jgi:hypothetical protein
MAYDFGMAGYLGHIPAPQSLEAASAIFSFAHNTCLSFVTTESKKLSPVKLFSAFLIHFRNVAPQTQRDGCAAQVEAKEEARNRPAHARRHPHPRADIQRRSGALVVKSLGTAGAKQRKITNR